MPTLHQSRRLFRNAAEAVYGEPWAILPAKLDAIVELLALRAEGLEFTAAEIRERTGARVAMGDDEDEPAGPRTIEGVAVLPLVGTIAQRMNMLVRFSGGTSTEIFGDWFSAALKDPNVRAILLHVDSPGGQVQGVTELADQIFAARGTKPIWAIADPLMASGAYWIASAADEVIATPSAGVGSIGVYTVHTDASQAYADRGYRVNVIAAGKHKVDANPYEPLSSQARGTLQERVDQIYEQFVGAVAKNRRAQASDVRAGYGQGKVLFAQAALSAGLVDRIDTFAGTLQRLRATASPAPPRSAITIQLQTSSPPSPVASPAAGDPQPEKVLPMNPQLKAALVARGIIPADAADAVALTGLSAFFAAHGQPVPKEPADQIAAVLSLGLAKTEPAAPPANPAPAAAVPTANSAGQATPTPQAAALAERARIADLRARGAVLEASAEQIEAAIESGQSADAFAAAIVAEKAKTHRPVSTTGVIKPGAAEADTLHAGALDALCLRANVPLRDAAGAPRAPHQAAAEVRGMRLSEIAAAFLRAKGVRIQGLDTDSICKQYLATAPAAWTPFGSERAGNSFNTPSLFPNLLSALAGKIMDQAIDYAEATYREWCSQLGSVPDFKPKTIIAMGATGELPRVPDGDDFPQDTNVEEASWIATDTFGKQWKMTPVMMANDDLDGFSTMAMDYQIAHELTVNRLCVELLTSNPTLPDGIAFFHASHNNLVTPGAAPNVAQLSTMRLNMRNQQAPGNKRRLRIGPSIVLLPNELETGAEQLLLPLTIVPTTDTTTNPFRNKLRPVVEPMLSDASAVIWYALAAKERVRTIVYMFQQGFENGKRETYYDPASGSQCMKIEGRVGAAIRNWRGAQRNNGT